MPYYLPACHETSWQLQCSFQLNLKVFWQQAFRTKLKIQTMQPAFLATHMVIDIKPLRILRLSRCIQRIRIFCGSAQRTAEKQAARTQGTRLPAKKSVAANSPR